MPNYVPTFSLEIETGIEAENYGPSCCNLDVALDRHIAL